MDPEHGAGADDPFEHLRLDDDFVRAATIKEPRRPKPNEIPPLLPARRAGHRRRRAAHALRRVLAAVVAVALVVAAAWFSTHGRLSPTPSVRSPHRDVVGTGEISLAAGMPPASKEEQPAPIGRRPAVPPGDGPYAFARLQPTAGAPVAYDPCRPVHVVVNGRGAPEDGPRIVREALARASEATGLTFVDDGATDEMPVDARPPYQPDRYPGRWAPVLIAWSDETVDARLEGDTAGYAGSISLTPPGLAESVYVTGQVVLDGAQLDEVLGRPGGIAAARAVVLHELGHLVGLDHVGDPSQIMYPSSSDVTEYSRGDRAGLAQLGGGRCFPGI